MKSDKVEDSLPEEFGKYQKLNLILSILILVFLILFSYFVEFPILILFSLLFLIVISYYEQKANFCPKKYSKYIFLINSTGIFATIVFWFVPLDLNIQLIILIIGLYLILEYFATRGYFVKENVLIAQHVLAVSSFIVIIYSFYSFFDIFSFIHIDVRIDPILEFLLHTLTILSLTLISFYYLYVRHFRKHTWDNFNRCMMILILLIELTSYIVINLRNYFSLSPYLFSNGLILSTILFPGIFLIFTFINYLIGVFSQKTTLSYSYYSSWGLMLTIGLSIMFMYIVSNIAIVISILLFFSISSYYLLKFGQKIEKVSESSIVKFTRINSYFIFIELFFLLFFIFFDLFSYFALYDDIIISASAYASFIGITFLNNTIFKKKLISESNRVVINELSLIFTSVLIFYYSFIYLFGSFPFLVLVFPLLISSIFFYIPLRYILTKTTHQSFIKELIKLNSIVLCASLLLIPTVFNLQLVSIGYDFNAFNVVNFTLYIFYGISVFIYNFSRQLKIREKRIELIVKLQIIIGFIVTGTTMFYYPYILLKGTPYSIIFPLLSASSFLFIPLIFSYKKEFFNTKLVKKIINLNSHFILIELFILLFSIFFDLFSSYLILNINDDIIISAYMSYIGITFLTNLIFKKKLISESNRVVINELSLIFTSILIFYYSFIYFFGSILVLVFPFLISSIFFYIPLRYILAKTTHQSFIKRLIKLNSIVLCASLLLIPTVFSLELVPLGYDFNIFNVVNFTLYIFYGILFFIYNFSRQLKIKVKRIELIVKLQIIIGFIVTGTTMFYYPYVLLKETSYLVIFPLLSASSFLFIPLIFSYKKEFFNIKLVKKIIILNSFLFWIIIIFIPSIIGLEIVRLGIVADPILIILFSVILFFVSLKFFDQISSYIELKEAIIKIIKIIQPITWLFISILISLIFFNLNLIVTITWLRNVIFAGALLLFFVFNTYNLVLLDDLKQSVFEDETSKLDHYKIYKIYEFNKNIIIFGVIISASLIFSSIVQVINYNQFFIDNNLQLLGFNLDIAIFLLILLLALNVSDKLIKIDFERVKVTSELIIWIILKSIILFTLALYPIQLSLFSKITLLILVFAVLSPISHFYLERRFLLLENTQSAIRKSIGGLFFLSIICLSIEIIWNISSIILAPHLNQEMLKILVFGKIFLFSNYYFLRYNTFTERESGFHIYKLYGISLVLLISYLFPLSLVFLLPFMVFLLQRNRDSYFRLFFYLMLSIVTFIEATCFLVSHELLPSLEALSISMSSSIYLISLISVFFISIILNLKRENNIEKFILYFLISLLSFILLAPYIYLIYNTTTSLFIFLSLVGIFYYRKEEKRYKWFIKPCILLMIFNFISFLSFSFFFNNIIFATYNPILSFTLTLSASGFAFVFLYNDSPRLFRKRSFYAVLASNIISFPVFLYFIFQ